MGRREDREAVQSTWSVYEAARPGEPFVSGAIDDAEARPVAAAPSEVRPALENRRQRRANLASVRRTR